MLDTSKLAQNQFSFSVDLLVLAPYQFVKNHDQSLPKYTIYVPAKGNKGSFIEYKKIDRDNGKIIRFKTTSRKNVSLDDKFKEMRKKIKDIVGKKYILKAE